MREDARYWIALSFVNGLGDVFIKSLFSDSATPKRYSGLHLKCSMRLRV
jgi:hypothetical protein